MSQTTFYDSILFEEQRTVFCADAPVKASVVVFKTKHGNFNNPTNSFLHHRELA
jgi:hypothetical protein